MRIDPGDLEFDHARLYRGPARHLPDAIIDKLYVGRRSNRGNGRDLIARRE